MVRNHNEGSRLRKRGVLGQELRIDMPVGGDDRKRFRLRIEFAGNSAKSPIRIEETVLVEVESFSHEPQTPPNTEKPPSTGMTVPVTKEAASLQSQRTAPVSSSGSPRRPIGV